MSGTNHLPGRRENGSDVSRRAAASFNIKCVNPFAGVTQEGIGIGSTRAELIKAYGNPSQDQHFDHGDENLWFAPLSTSFYLENDKITSFIVHLNVR
jgi:hypothetical protein